MNEEKGLPIDWRKMIEGKKVIFFNTSIGNLLTGGKRHIDKIAQILDVFKKQSEVILWWRPHPLELSTIDSMRQDLAIAYKALRQQYEQERWGILDTSADLHRAIAVSDAYYGDWSSVIHLYQVTKKPILLLKDEAVNYRDEIMYSVQDFVIVNEDMWFVSNMYNYLFRMNMKSYVVEEVLPIPGNRLFQQNVMDFIVNIENKLFLIPRFSENIAVYDMKEKTMRTIVVGDYTKYPKFLEYYYDNSNLFLTSIKRDEVVIVDIHSLRIKKINVDKSKKKQSKLWFWDEEKKEICDMECFPQEYKYAKERFDITAEVGDLIYIFPSYSNMILKVNRKTKTIEKYSNIIMKDYPYVKFTVAKNVKGTIYAYSLQRNGWLIIDTNTEKEVLKKVEATKQVKMNMLEKYLFDVQDEYIGKIKNAFIATEDEWKFTIVNFIAAVCKGGDCVNESNSGFQLCGKKIYESITNGE